MKIRTLLLSLSLLTFLSAYSQFSITGELRKWHTVTITFDGPASSESDANNPFLNYRLNVTFTGPNGAQTIVPGFFAADGNAGETGAISGNKWRVRFTPDQQGTWNFSASFRTGTNVSIDLTPAAGVPTSFDGTSGNFTISNSDKLLPDNRAQGRLNYVGVRYLRFQDSGNYFLKAGADSPENLLAYADFDNTVPSKNWAAHTQDWQNGDPVWHGSKGQGLIGAVNYLSAQGMNAFSFLTLNVNGDGKDVWPFAAVSHDLLDDNSAGDQDNRTRYDVSKLAQWEILMDHADKKGMYLHFKTQETENKGLLDGSQLGVQRKLYYRELIARFGHHLALNWNLGEEFDIYDPNLIKSYATYIKDVDPYDHHIVIHSYAYDYTQDQLYLPLLGDNDLTGPSLQVFKEDIHKDVKRWVEASKNSGKNWVVANDEQGDYRSGVTTDAAYPGDKGIQPDNRQEVRNKVLWATLMAGGAGVEYYFGYETGVTDLNAQDWRSRSTKWQDAKRALDFFRQHLPYWQMESYDELTSHALDYCFAKPGDVYAIYLPDGGITNLNLLNYPGTYSVDWFNPRDGGTLLKGSVSNVNGGAQVSLGTPPNSNSIDWVAVVRKTGEGSGGNTGGGCEADFEEVNGLVIMESENFQLPMGWNISNSAPGFSGNSYIEWLGGDSFNTPGNGVISTAIKINTPGTYLLRWHNKVGLGADPTEHNDSWLRFPDADDFFGGQPGGSVVYPHGSGKSPVVHGSGSDGWFKVNSSGTVNWNWSTYTNDGNGHFIYITFNNPGIYTMQISGRSNHHMIDRVTMTLDANIGTDLGLAETPCDEPSNTTVAVTGITITPASLNLQTGQTFQLTAEVLPAEATDKSVFWYSTDPAVATVSQNGFVTAVAQGNVNISATTNDGQKSATVSLEVLSNNQEPPSDPNNPPPGSCQGDYLNVGDVVVMEAENLTLAAGWNTGTSNQEFTGTGYISWEGGDQFSSPGTGLISTKIYISEAGTYKFEWRNKVGQGADPTEHNDSWLRFPDADDFYGQKENGSTVYPHGSGQTPVTAGSGADGWFKVNSSAPIGAWTWTTYTNDGDGHNIYVTFNSPGLYTMEISGRSNYHLIDRIVLSKGGRNGTDLALEETPCMESPQQTGFFMSIEGDTAKEGENLEFFFHLSSPSETPIVAEIGIINETAEFGDYDHLLQPLVFEPGYTSASVVVPTYTDGIQEGDESFKIVVTHVSGGPDYDISTIAKGVIIDADADMTVHPNPAESNGSIKLYGMQDGNYQIGIYSIGGELVSFNEMEVDGEIQLNLPSLSKGFYIVKADKESKSYTSKIMIK